MSATLAYAGARPFVPPILTGTVVALVLGSAGTITAQSLVTFPTADGGLVEADLYAGGSHAVVLAHGGRFDKASWQPEAQTLAGAGFRVLAINFRGYGASRGPGMEDPLGAPLHLDIMAAVDYLGRTDATTVAVVGGSMGGTAAAVAAATAPPGAFHRLVLLAAPTGPSPERITIPSLFIVARGDTTAAGRPRLDGIRPQYDRVAGPKRLVVFEGTAHAQLLFQTDQREQVMQELLGFLSQP